MLKHVTGLTVLLILFSVSSFAETWNIDVVHSSIGFKVRHMVVSKTRGEFTDFEGVIDYRGGLTGSSVEFSIKTASLNTNDEDRDNHVRSADFLDAEKFPTMSFKSTRLTDVHDGTFKLIGDLTLKDVTKEVTFDCEYLGMTEDHRGNHRMGFSAVTKIDRQEFDVSFDSVLESGGLLVGNDVEISLEIEAIKSKPEQDSK